MGQMRADSFDFTRSEFTIGRERRFFIGEMRIFVLHSFTVDRRVPNAPATFPTT